MELIPGNSLITESPEAGRRLAMDMALHSIYAIQPDDEVLKTGRQVYATDPDELIASSQVVALEFATIAAANHYWR
ncbi:MULTISPECIES: hexameric tyrosine-coordinated heme protein [Arthrobacter]|uniref:hexameric tyrosine-coordinated heme protein n=1 Tax=Arthrobacter TaxID=1663 RepID=UPI0008359B8C|nr:MULTISPECIES: hexameric tyrosine-coordinated heme protein [Arthrobacter]UPO76304.1 hexameric tyrosine-coordinated heme protein [Arthrobacter sp. Helios]